ncbi:MAG: DHHA1 domain-containing protein [Haloarculaceae archaeon]
MESNAPADPYVTTFETTVDRVDGTDVLLEETYFYPEGGGQPADRGHLVTAGDASTPADGVEVVDVQKGDDGVVHTLATEPDFGAGDAVAGHVDEAFRTYCMRAHTASHVLYGAGRRLLDDLGYGGFDIAAERVRVDFTTPTDVDDETLIELERLVNRAVWESRPVTWENLPREEALQLETIAFNAKTEEGVTGDETVRVVTVGKPGDSTGKPGDAAGATGDAIGATGDVAGAAGDDARQRAVTTAETWDVAACGGTHVSNTREIGPVTVLDRSNPGEGMTRVEFAVGPTAIDRRARETLAARQAARHLDTRVLDLPEMVQSVTDEREELREEVDDLTERAVEARLADLREESVERDGREWIVGEVAGLDANELAEEAQRLAGDAADVVVLVGEGAEYLAAAANGDVDAADVVEEATSTFGGGGGGSHHVAQAGGLNARADEVVALYRG